MRRHVYMCASCASVHECVSIRVTNTYRERENDEDLVMVNSGRQADTQLMEHWWND